MKHFLLSAITAAGVMAGMPLYAQQTEAVDTAVFNRIRKAELSSSQIPTIAHYLTDVSGPRLTGSAGYKRAGEWAVETLKKWGLVNAKMEPWGEFGKQWDLDEFSLVMKTPYIQPVRAHADPWSIGTGGAKQGEVVIISQAQSMDTLYLAKHLAEYKGKFILITGGKFNSNAGFKPMAARLTDEQLANMKDTYMITNQQMKMYAGYFKIFAKVDELYKESGTLGVITASSANSNGTIFVQGHDAYKLTAKPSVPKVSMAYEDGLKIKRLTESGHKVELSLNIASKFATDDVKGYNVIAEIPGTDRKLKSQLIMLGGHLDSWQSATGATDNAAGCIVMMEVVRLLDSLQLKPKRTIRIALWGGEEQGLLGSYGYIKNHFRGGNGVVKPEQAKVSAYFNLDNGTGKIRGIFTQNNEAVKPVFEKWFEPFHDLGAKTVTNSNTGSTDHIAFDWAGIPGFQFIQDPIDYETRTHHSNLDDYDHLQIEDLKQAAIIIASFVYQAGNRADILPRKPLDKEGFVFDGF